MRTRRQQRESEKEEAKSAPMQIEDAQEDVEQQAETSALEEIVEDVPMGEQTPLSVLPDDVDAYLKIEAADGQPEERLQKILQILAEQQYQLKKDCAKKLKADNDDAEQLMAKLLRKIGTLPEEFLDSQPNDELLSQIRLPVVYNLPSCKVGKTKEPQQRVVRVFNMDANAEQVLAEWETKYDELFQHLDQDQNKGL